jgi:hypothetical protein
MTAACAARLRQVRGWGTGFVCASPGRRAECRASGRVGGRGAGNQDGGHEEDATGRRPGALRASGFRRVTHTHTRPHARTHIHASPQLRLIKRSPDAHVTNGWERIYPHRRPSTGACVFARRHPATDTCTHTHAGLIHVGDAKDWAPAFGLACAGRVGKSDLHQLFLLIKGSILVLFDASGSQIGIPI